MKVVRTVLGDIDPKELGVCDCHDHLLRTYGPEIQLNDWYDMSSMDAAQKEFQDFLDAGGKSMVCMDPLGCGRDVPKMLELAKRFKEKGHLIMTTGFHKGSLYDNRGHWSLLYPRKVVADLIAKEVNEGMDLYSYAGPIVQRCAAKAGVIKAGTSMRNITPFEQNIIAIDCEAQKECGAPISINTDYGTMAMDIVKLLKEEGADIEHCILCHTNKINDRTYFQQLLDTGINLAFEGPDRPEWAPDIEVAENIKYLVEHGYENQIMLAMDAGRSTFQKHYMAEKGCIAHGISYMLTDFVPLMKEVGISESSIHSILVDTPARVLAIG